MYIGNFYFKNQTGSTTSLHQILASWKTQSSLFLQKITKPFEVHIL